MIRQYASDMAIPVRLNAAEIAYGFQRDDLRIRIEHDQAIARSVNMSSVRSVSLALERWHRHSSGGSATGFRVIWSTSTKRLSKAMGRVGSGLDRLSQRER